MRFSIELKLKAEQSELIQIPKNYRQYIASLLKEGLQATPEGKKLFNKVYSTNKPIESIKPFTFSCYLPIKRNGFEKEKFFQLGKNFIKLFVSTNDYEFLLLLYNGLQSLREKRKNFNFFGYPVEISRFFLFSKRIFSDHRITFKTVSPLLVRNLRDGKKYLIPEDCIEDIKDNRIKYFERADWDSYKGALLASMKTTIKRFLNDENCSLQIEIYRARAVPVIHGSKDSNFLVTFCGLNCFLKVNGSPQVQELFYDIGIGARRSEGFGMLEAVE